MKKKWLDDFGLADEGFIEEAAPKRPEAKKKKKRIFISVLAACACLAIVFVNLWLFLPLGVISPDIAMYKDSEYYPIIEKMSSLLSTHPYYSNNYEKYFSSGPMKDIAFGGVSMDKGFFYEADAAPDAASNTASGNADIAQDVTDNQVAGVIEADKIKRSGDLIFYLDESVLKVYRISGEDTEKIGEYTVTKSDGGFYNRTFSWEFFISEDGETVTVFHRSHSKDNRVSVVCIDSLDVGDPTAITLKRHVEIEGNYVTSRRQSGALLLVLQYNPVDIDFSTPTTFLPGIDYGEGKQCLPSDKIIVPDTIDTTRYTVAVKFDADTLECIDAIASLSYTDTVYVSTDNLYLVRSYLKKCEDDSENLNVRASDITSIRYTGTDFSVNGTVSVNGSVKDKWSMDEKDGILRVVTTTSKTRSYHFSTSEIYSDVIWIDTSDSTNASLYCIDLTDLTVVSSVENFAPQGESVRSVRYDGDKAYVCTSVVFTDPVFCFDLSNIRDITYVSTPQINGYSDSLIDLGNGFLLGIGQENRSTMKIEIYRETPTSVECICKYLREDCYYSSDYKSYYVDRENRLIGLGIDDYSDYERQHRYIVVYFDGYELDLLVDVSLEGAASNKRGVYVDEYMYMFGKDDFKVVKPFE